VALFTAGVRIGGKWLDARGPELLAQLAVNR
jgi:ABC-2 type transport system permease protein